MTRTIDIPTFQAAVVRNCSPTLAGIKPASLFTYPGTYAHGDGSTATETIAERRARLLNVIAQCNRELEPYGIHLSVLVWRPCGALIYAYRPANLMRHLSDSRAAAVLATEVYNLRFLPRLHAAPHPYLSTGPQPGKTCPGNPIEHTNRGRTPHNRKENI